MCKKTIWRSACAIVTFCGWYIAAAPMALQAQQVVIRGSIVTPDGLPLLGSVTIIEGTREVLVSTYRTDANGMFAIPTSWAPQKRVAAKSDGFVSSEAVISVRPGQQEITHNFTLSPAASVSGRVMDESGAPVPDATVRVRYIGESRMLSFAQEVGASKSDDFGYFSLPIVARGKQFVLDAVSSERPLASSMVLSTQSATLTNVVVTMSRRGYPVTGRIANGSGQPITDLRVRLVVTGDLERYSREERASVSFTAAAAKVAVTDDQGRFAFAGVPSGKITVIVETPQNRTRKDAILNHALLDVDVSVALAQ